MYILNKKEQAVLKIIVKNAKNDFFRNNKYIFVEETSEDKIIFSNKNIIADCDEEINYQIEITKLENIFEDKKIYNIVRALTYNEKSVLYFYYVKQKTEEEIAQIMFSTSEAIRSKRRRIIKKIRREVDKNV